MHKQRYDSENEGAIREIRPSEGTIRESRPPELARETEESLEAERKSRPDPEASAGALAVDKTVGERVRVAGAVDKTVGERDTDKAAGSEYEDERPRRILHEILDWVKVVLIAVLLALLLVNFVIQRNQVQGTSMLPTLQPRDELWVQKVTKLWGGIHRGDIVTIHGADIRTDTSLNEEDLVKRVIGMPGEHVEIQNGYVYIDGKQLNEPYLASSLQTGVGDGRYADVRLGADEYYVLGDNRPASRDSRYFGPVPGKAILGEVWFRSLPWSRFGPIR